MMRRRSIGLVAAAAATLGLAAVGGGPASAAPSSPTTTLGPAAIEAAAGPVRLQSEWLQHDGAWSGCTAAKGALHCYLPSDIRSAYGVDRLSEKGDGQTIVLVDSYGSPRAAEELQAFHDAFFPGEPQPDFEQVFPIGNPQEKGNPGARGQSGPGAAASWAGEAALDVQWAYAMAPHAHIVLLAVPPAETLGVQGFPTLFRAISEAVDTYPAGTVFSMSLGVAEPTFEGATAQQTARFDEVFQKGIAKGDSFFAASGDNGDRERLEAAEGRPDLLLPHGRLAELQPVRHLRGRHAAAVRLDVGPPQRRAVHVVRRLRQPAYFAATAGGHTDVVWNESWLPAATGGAPSAVYPRPSWQDGVASVIGGDHRGAPDLSWNAAVNGAVLVNLQSYLPAGSQGFYLIGGTSAATPQVAALSALANERRAAGPDAKAPLGNVAPRLYSLPSAAFTDVVPVHQGDAGVVSGDLTSNRLFSDNGDGNPVTPGPVDGYPTLAGYDLTTGLGTPWAPAYVAGLAAQP